MGYSRLVPVLGVLALALPGLGGAAPPDRDESLLHCGSLQVRLAPSDPAVLNLQLRLDRQCIVGRSPLPSGALSPEAIRWLAAAASRSTVLVDDRAPVGGPVVVLDRQSGAGGFGLLDVDATGAFRPWPDAQVTRYRRTLLLVPRPESGCYLLDVFRLRGGSRHDYLLHVTADREAAIDFPMADLPGSLRDQDSSGAPAESRPAAPATAPTDMTSGYALVTRLQRSRLHRRGFQVAWRGGIGKEAFGLRLHGMTKPWLTGNDEVFLARTPVVQADGHLFPGGQSLFVHRRTGRFPVESCFVNLLAPALAGQERMPPLRIESLRAWGAWRRSSVALAIHFDGVTDLVFHNGEAAQLRYRDADGRLYTVDGRFAWARVRDNQLQRLELVGRTMMVGELGLALRRPAAATLSGVPADTPDGAGAILVRSRDRLPEGRAMLGRRLRIRHADGTATAGTIAGLTAQPEPGTYRVDLTGPLPEVGVAGRIRAILRRGMWLLAQVDEAKAPADEWFRNKLIHLSDGGKAIRIRGVVSRAATGSVLLELDRNVADSTKAGGGFRIGSLAVGDRVELPARASLVRRGPGQYTLHTTGDVTLRVPRSWGGMKLRYRDRDGDMAEAPLLPDPYGFRIPVADLIDGSTELTIDPSTGGGTGQGSP